MRTFGRGTHGATRRGSARNNADAVPLGRKGIASRFRKSAPEIRAEIARYCAASHTYRRLITTRTHGIVAGRAGSARRKGAPRSIAADGDSRKPRFPPPTLELREQRRRLCLSPSHGEGRRRRKSTSRRNFQHPHCSRSLLLFRMFQHLPLREQNALQLGDRHVSRHDVAVDREMGGDPGRLSERHPSRLHPNR